MQETIFEDDAEVVARDYDFVAMKGDLKDLERMRFRIFSIILNVELAMFETVDALDFGDFWDDPIPMLLACPEQRHICLYFNHVPSTAMEWLDLDIVRSREGAS